MKLTPAQIAEFEEQGAKSYRYNGTTHWEKFVDMPPDFQWTDDVTPNPD